MRPPHAKDPLLDKCEPWPKNKDKCDLKRGLGWRNPFNLKILFLTLCILMLTKKKVMHFDHKKTVMHGK